MSLTELPKRCDSLPFPESLNNIRLSFGSYLPQRILTNEEIESWNVRTASGELLTAEKISQKTGILTRRIANQEETPFAMAICAVKDALGQKPEKNIDAVIVQPAFLQAKIYQPGSKKSLVFPAVILTYMLLVRDLP